MATTTGQTSQLHAFMHLRRSMNPTGVPPRTPFVCSILYDGGEFLQYPVRAGWPQILPHPSRPLFSNYDGAHPADDTEFADFIQRWLVFGLLQTVIGDSFDPERYIASDDRGKFVHTKHLADDLVQLTPASIIRGHENAAMAYKYHVKCFQQAEDVLVITSRPQHSAFSRAIRQSTAVLCESLCVFIDKLLPQSTGSDMPMSWKRIYADATVMTTMQQHGWCGSEVVRALETFVTASAIHFIHYMDRPSTGRTHIDCSAIMCADLVINDETYRPAHAPGCNGQCDDLIIPAASLGLCLDAHETSIPLLQISGQNLQEMVVNIVSSEDHAGYVSLSHVWADGLGNKQENALPRCQILRMQTLLDGLGHHIPWNATERESRQLLFWCDTLCVPVFPRHDNNPQQTSWWQKAMARMRTTYQNSTYTLVLDKTLSHYSLAAIGPIEAALRAFTSPWMHRLWTFQEGVLPTNLLFQFSDQVIDIRKLWRHARECKENETIPLGLYTDIIIWCQTIRRPFHATPDGQGMDLASVTISLRHRAVSNPVDEPLCISTLLNLDTTQIVQAPETVEARMARLWELMPNARGGIPKDLIFNELPRLRAEGFQWAPSTLLQDLGAYSAIKVTHNNDISLQGMLVLNQGLKVVYPAWRINRGTDPLNMQSVYLPASEGQQLRFRDTNGTWLWIMHVSQGLLPQETKLMDLFQQHGELMLVVNQIPSLGGARFGHLQSALLGKLVDKYNDVARIRPLAIAQVVYASPDQQSFWTKAFELAQIVREDIQQNVSEFQGMAGTKLVQEAHRVLSADPSLAATLRLSTADPNQAANLLAAQASRFLVGADIQALEVYDENSTWLIT